MQLGKNLSYNYHRDLVEEHEHEPAGPPTRGCQPIHPWRELAGAWTS